MRSITARLGVWRHANLRSRPPHGLATDSASNLEISRPFCSAPTGKLPARGIENVDAHPGAPYVWCAKLRRLVEDLFN